MDKKTMARRQKTRQKLTPFFSWAMRGIWQALTTIVAWVVSVVRVILTLIIQKVNHLINYLVQRKLVLFVLFLFLAFGLLGLAAIIPRTHIFEGNLIVEELSFTYSGSQNKLFLDSMRGIHHLEIDGVINNELTFTGEFKSTSFTELNQLKKPLKIRLQNRNSKLIIEPVDTKNSSDIDLTELRLLPDTKVSGFTYNLSQKQHRLDFDLQHNPTSQTQPNELKIYLGEKPIKVILENYDISGLNQNKLDKQQPLEFLLTPNKKELNLELKQKNSIYLSLDESNKNDPNLWFQEKIDTKDVHFQRLDRTGDISDDVTISTIVEGKIRMVEQEREIKANQFLMGDEPNTPLNIERIRHLQIVPKKGLEVRISGRTKQIQIGLDKDFPVSRIQGSWLDGFLPRDAIVALFSFSAATITYLLGFLIENASKSDSNPKSP
ncbi:hypothetical protein [Scytonema sp. PCC 10023]|uniref:hypothetical protein n=1 Tax=Scytonema sp. PCC 10023 TaxID=1680591 RepID=UPI0039C61F8B